MYALVTKKFVSTESFLRHLSNEFTTSWNQIQIQTTLLYFYTYNWLDIEFQNMSFTIYIPFLDLECFSLYQTTKVCFAFIKRIVDNLYHKDDI